MRDAEIQGARGAGLLWTVLFSILHSALLIRHTENGVSWGMVVAKKDLYCTPPSLPLAPEQILMIVGRYTKDNPTELDRNWELVMISALKDVFPCVDATRG